MMHNERMLYEKNNRGYYLVLSFIATNILYSILTLNTMEIDARIGLFIFITIPLLLVGFLMAVKIQLYSKTWSKIALGIGIFQVMRVCLQPSTDSFPEWFSFISLLIISGLLCFIGGLVSLRKSRKREDVIQMQKESDDGRSND